MAYTYQHKLEGSFLQPAEAHGIVMHQSSPPHFGKHTTHYSNSLILQQRVQSTD